MKSPLITSLIASYLCLVLMGLSSLISIAHAASFDYALKPVKIAEDTYLLEGKQEEFSRDNGGNIVNTAFIVTQDGVVVIDTGPSLRYGQQQRQAIATLTDKPIKKVIITHHHPDHFLGNQAYSDVPIYALPETQQSMRQEGEMFSSNMYRLVGDWMRGTELFMPQHEAKVGIETLGKHKLEILSYDGHTSADLVLFDHTTGVLFAGDLVFNKRTPTTPHAISTAWINTLKQLVKLPFKVLVSGHGAVSVDDKPIHETQDYLTWLNSQLYQAANQGMDMTEVMMIAIPERFQDFSLLRDELSRSVTHLYPAIELGVLKPANHEDD